jgi:dipeptidyl aminopeptidase/acylaminoacyl peptidase
MSASQMLDLCLQRRNLRGNTNPPASYAPSWLSILLILVYSTYCFCMCFGEQSGIVTDQSRSKTEEASVKRPVTVADFIQMTRFGDPSYDAGGPSKGLVAKFSPDGKRFVVALRKGNLETNTNEFSLILFDTDEVFRSPHPRALLSMASSSNRPAIQNVVWLADNDTLLFLGEHPGETTQLYSFACSSKELDKLTNHATNLSSFVTAPNGTEIVFAAENPEILFANDNAAHRGINVTSESLSELIAGKHGGKDYDDHALFLKQTGSEVERKITTQGRVRSNNEMSLSPDGQHLVIQTEASSVPDAWTDYDDQFLKTSKLSSSAPGARTSVFQYELVDIHAGSSYILLDAPIPSLGGSEAAWAPDSQSVILSDMYLPLNVDDQAERGLRKTHPFLVELLVPSRQFVKISDEDLRLLNWDAKTSHVVCDVGRLDSFTGKATSKAYFAKRKNTWSRAETPHAEEDAAHTLPDIVLDENMNGPPRIIAVARVTGQKSLLMDLDPQLRALDLARVEEITWTTTHHHEVKGGLYWPLDYVAGRKYPLVIQTHGWEPNRFWIDGPWTTTFAAQALAGKDFFVLQVSDIDWSLIETPKEVPAALALYDSAIDFLDRKGLIDRDRIGITGFSRTFLYATYALTHSKHHFAAADIADGVDYGYFQYMLSANSDQRVAASFDSLNGAPPFGKGLHKWLKVSPAFLMDRIETPLRIQTLYPASLLSDWHWFSGLITLGKPVEMIYIPEGTHILEKPWDRMISQQGNVDWFCFWLKDEEDPDPHKIEQYQRWHKLRAMSDRKTSVTLQ